MRSAALCLLAIAAPACNWVLGLDPTQLVDAGPPGDGPLPVARLTWMVALTDTTGGPAAAPEFPAITPAPSVQIGRIAGELADATIDDTGTIELPYDFATTAWRLVYQLADDVPREVHWTPVATYVPHAIVPLFGRLDRAPIPGPSTTLSLTATGSLAPANHRGPRVFTTGVWTESQPVFPVPPGPTFNYNLNQSIQLSGPPGAPERAKGDFVVLADFATTPTCRVSEGSAAYTVDLSDGASTTISAEPWANTGASVVASGDLLENRVRVTTSAGGSDPNGVVSTILIGPTPSVQLPGFTRRVSFLGLRAPLVLPMLQCSGATLSALPVFNSPPALSVFPQVAHLQLTADRTPPGGPTFTSGLAAVMPVATGTASFDLTIAMPIPPMRLGTADLSTTDGVMLAAGTEPLVLTFAVEPAPTYVPADYYDIALHRVSGTTAVLERVYTVTAPTLTFERSILAAGTDYVLEIRAYRGAENAKLADFRTYKSTQSSGVVWTRTFRAP